jgi:hypothetical protein
MFLAVRRNIKRPYLRLRSGSRLLVLRLDMSPPRRMIPMKTAAIMMKIQIERVSGEARNSYLV